MAKLNQDDCQVDNANGRKRGNQDKIEEDKRVTEGKMIGRKKMEGKLGRREKKRIIEFKNKKVQSPNSFINKN